MSRAVCLACGAWKWGALVRCKQCGLHPREPVDQARHLLASSDHADEAQLLAIARAVVAKEPVEFDPDELESLTALVERIPTVPFGFALLVTAGPASLLLLLLLLATWALRG